MLFLTLPSAFTGDWTSRTLVCSLLKLHSKNFFLMSAVYLSIYLSVHSIYFFAFILFVFGLLWSFFLNCGFCGLLDLGGCHPHAHIRPWRKVDVTWMQMYDWRDRKEMSCMMHTNDFQHIKKQNSKHSQFQEVTMHVSMREKNHQEKRETGQLQHTSSNIQVQTQSHTLSK